jgi:uncharacterized membrane protein
MFVANSILAFCLIFMGIYCLFVRKQSDYGWICTILGVIIVPTAIALPIPTIIEAFKDEEILQAIICIAICLLEYFCAYKFAKYLWYYK